MANFLPASLHRALLPYAHVLRKRWRRWRATPFSGVSAVVTNRAGDVLLVRHSYGTSDWSLPGGGLGRGEEPKSGLCREIREELALALDNVRLVQRVEEVIYNSPHTACLFTATCDAEPVPDEREVIEARFFAAHALPHDLCDTAARRINIWREWARSQDTNARS
ncbi:MAG: NUDIX domain-containing protein [Erythrobacter sp.]|nr:NUDIX domain-containing protein [Erythrobacter sp.]